MTASVSLRISARLFRAVSRNYIHQLKGGRAISAIIAHHVLLYKVNALMILLHRLQLQN